MLCCVKIRVCKNRHVGQRSQKNLKKKQQTQVSNLRYYFNFIQYIYT